MLVQESLGIVVLCVVAARHDADISLAARLARVRVDERLGGVACGGTKRRI